MLSCSWSPTSISIWIPAAHLRAREARLVLVAVSGVRLRIPKRAPQTAILASRLGRPAKALRCASRARIQRVRRVTCCGQDRETRNCRIGGARRAAWAETRFHFRTGITSVVPLAGCVRREPRSPPNARLLDVPGGLAGAARTRLLSRAEAEVSGSWPRERAQSGCRVGYLCPLAVTPGITECLPPQWELAGGGKSSSRSAEDSSSSPPRLRPQPSRARPRASVAPTVPGVLSGSSFGLSGVQDWLAACRPSA